MDADEVREAISDHVVQGLEVARNAAGMRPGGTLLLMGGTGGRRIRREIGLASAATAVLPPFVATLALELAPVRVNLIAAGFVDTPLSASLLGDGLEARRQGLRENLPIGRVVGPEDVAALAVHIMANTALHRRRRSDIRWRSPAVRRVTHGSGPGDAGDHPSLLVALDGRRIPDLGVVRIGTGAAARTTLAQQVPAAIELDLDLVEALTVAGEGLIVRAVVLLARSQRVLFVHEPFDAA